MWIFLARAGFFSVVQHDGHPDQLVVRARVADDLARLKKLYLPGLSTIESTPARDYGFRSTCTKKAFAAALEKAVEAIDFANFKDRVAEEMGRSRAQLCAEVWSVMRRLQVPGRGTTK